MSASKLTKRQQIFVKEYRIDRNATRAAIAAGYSDKGANVAGHRLLTNAKVAAEVNIEHAEIVNKLDVTAEKVITELARCGFSDPRKFFNEDGSLMAVTDLDDEAAAALASVEVDEIWEGSGEDRKVVGYTKKVKFWSKPDTLGLLARYFKLLGNDRQPSVMVEVELGDARARLVAKLAS